MCQANGAMSWRDTYAQTLPDPLQNQPVESGETLVGAPEQWELHRNPLEGEQEQDTFHTHLQISKVLTPRDTTQTILHLFILHTAERCQISFWDLHLNIR